MNRSQFNMHELTNQRCSARAQRGVPVSGGPTRPLPRLVPTQEEDVPDVPLKIDFQNNKTNMRLWISWISTELEVPAMICVKQFLQGNHLGAVTLADRKGRSCSLKDAMIGLYRAELRPPFLLRHFLFFRPPSGHFLLKRYNVVCK